MPGDTSPGQQEETTVSNVRECDRRQGKLEVFNKARELAIYTIKICQNQNIFSPETDPVTVDNLRKNARDAYVLAWLGNNVRVRNEEDWKRRNAYQRDAIDACNALLVDIGMAKTIYHLRSRRVEYWAKMTVEVRNTLRKWNENDSMRYGKEKQYVSDGPQRIE